MIIVIQLLLFIFGFVLLMGGADFAIRNAKLLARRTGISTLTLGVLVVAFGTSLPELLVSVIAALKGHPAIALGNVIGSNIANVGLIVGVSALITSIAFSYRLTKVELPIVILSMIMMYFVASDLFMGRINSLAFLGCFVVYLVFVMTCERDRIIETVEVSDDLNPETPKDKLASDQSPKKLLLMTSVGLGILLAGSYMIVETGAGLARQIGISETLIGISLVAVGTSLPELAASIAAIRHKDTDIIMGNILGSNIFNILLVLGVAGLLHPFNIEHSIATYDILVMCLFTFALVPFMLKGRIGKGGGAFFLISYLIYIVLRFIADM